MKAVTQKSSPYPLPRQPCAILTLPGPSSMPAWPSSTATSSFTSIEMPFRARRLSYRRRLLARDANAKGLAPFCIGQLLPDNDHLRGRINAQTDYIPVDLHQGHGDIVAKLNPFADLAREHQHDCTPLRPSLGETSGYRKPRPRRWL